MTATIDDVVEHYAVLRGHLAALHTEAFLAIDVTMPQAQLLYMVVARPDMSVSSIARRFRVGLSAASGLVDRLVDHGYLDRHEDPSDRRQHLVSATPAGADIVERLRELDESLMHRLLVGLSQAELRALDSGIIALAEQAALLAADAPIPVSGTTAERTTA